jgi:hypothetical protein
MIMSFVLCSQAYLHGPGLSLFQVPASPVNPSIVIRYLRDIPSTIGVQVLLGLHLFDSSILNLLVSLHCLLGLSVSILSIYNLLLGAFSILNFFPLTVAEKGVNASIPSFRKQWLEKLVLIGKHRKSISEEIFEDVVGSQWLDGSEKPVIICLPLGLIANGIIGLIDLDEFILCLLIFWITLWMIFQSHLSIGLFDLIHRGIIGNSKD